ncbi:L-erythro-3,5-diaminohexanoate dehydrogenase [Clostridium algidicarnis]|uniref:L-erythro-3,5-diaminohexanoate dehydrogenase n=1 Tax=Clostridium algidicarnis TaxID=37659 RepID=UPI001C0D29B1|nr:L-erythro-3,5-diaminohexanoate dehydrogenase [Clostridium algidicarnis]MBU3204736.1 L-erythro-3,5-diaminohexanoate dehydrogenase [Clostridium algidicarnis]MBU3212779.1 L-erythro-3,5-diaminohexanoate dehydrogenase [Clostridium algidicarnis]MBU3223423.1 L-erythro-3,5-diaminohexanoate dehydrogenase [Clostridium algidicarnis]
MNKGCKYGTHRVIEPKGVLTQAAQKIDNDMKIYSNEILVDVQSLNIDSASFTQIEKEANHDIEKIKAKIIEIVKQRGKMQNPVTGSGGMFIGTVSEIGEDLKDIDIKVGDKIASLVSLSLTPLKIEEIIAVHKDIDRIDIKGQAILFESGLYAKLPEDLPENLALAALDVAGAPAQIAKLVKPGQSILIVGAAGKSGMLCCYEAMKRVGPTGRVIAMDREGSEVENLLKWGLCHNVIATDATKPIEVLNKTLEANNGKEVDVSVNCVNVANTEMSCILPVKDEGIVYFFSMATSFTKAALGAEGAGKDITMIVGNGYTKGHAEITLSELRESKILREIFTKLYI